ncbi:MAG TPA: polyprenyl diphosphate synthase [Steroidobacteraceae bacterium]|nr:polyprenyl diphosphate synthase [Steroidobacteraceae bacterium]
MHVAIIMDGNGRWAARRGLPRTAGHARGAKAVRRIVEATVRSGIATLTLYAFSADNWARPQAEVRALLRLLRRYLLAETGYCVDNGVRVNVIGRRDRLEPDLLRAVEQSERLTAAGDRLHLRIAVDYSARHSILEAARRGAPAAECDPEARFLELMNEVNHSALPAREVDLLIRTGGEKRLSDFLLWECAYAELYFTDCLWPEFDEQGLEQALDDFARRQRRFGKVPDGYCLGVAATQAD